MSSPYFLQTKEWFKFWQDLNLPNHPTYFFETQNLACYARQFPWHLGKSFLYIPKGPIAKNGLEINKNILEQEFPELLKKIKQRLKNQKIVFIKWEFSAEVFALDGDFEKYIKVLHKDFKLSDKHLQFTSTPILETASMVLDKEKMDLTNSNLLSFFEENKVWWKERNENVNRYTKKSLQQGWIISTTKTADNFENFWKIHLSTTNRQDFGTYSKQYFKTFFSQDSARIIVLKDEENQPQTVWLGVNIDGNLIYLYGGNTQKSFDKYGQYLVHLTALFMGVQEKIISYDLGGYDQTSGYGRFKENYKGRLINFGPAFDLPTNKFYYYLINTGIKITKKLKKKIKEAKALYKKLKKS